MAARENQGLQIAVIVFVMLTIVLSVTTFVFFRQAQEAEVRATAMQKRADASDADKNKAIEDANIVRGMIGMGQSDSIDKIRETFNKDKVDHMARFPESEQQYRKALSAYHRELDSSNAQTAEAQAREKELKDKLAADTQQHQQEIEKYKDALVKAENDLKSEKEKFDQDRQRALTEMNTLKGQLELVNKRSVEQATASSQKIKQLENVIADYKGRLGDLLQRVERQQVAMALPDGKVTYVNQASRLVWVNIGAEDGLRRQIRFTVVGQNEDNPVKAEKKASIEITQVVGPHISEARIVNDEISNPIIVGDQVFSPVWQAGRAEHFALAGFIDIDDDGRSDLATVRKLILSNGGIIDAQVAEDGTKTGKMTVNTSYLVLGNNPLEVKKKGDVTMTPAAAADEAPKANEAAAAYVEFRREAELLPVKIISLGDFLDHVGYKAEDRTIPLGSLARESDFKPRYPNGVQRISPVERLLNQKRDASRELAPKSAYGK